MDSDKLDFLQKDLIFHLKHLAPDARGKWGLMNGQQMVEHCSYIVRIANGKVREPLVNEGITLEKYRKFLLSDRPFRENTKNPLLPETPVTPKHATMQASILELETEIKDFAAVFERHPGYITLNPLFGELNFSENIQLLYKHALHHLTQFGLIENKLPDAGKQE